jgi:hypothetical protein
VEIHSCEKWQVQVRDREDALASTRDARTTQNLAALARIGVSIFTKYFLDKSRQDRCSELKEAPAGWFEIGQVVNRFDEVNGPMPQ